jgi:ATP-binding cassette subfamily B protein
MAKPRGRIRAYLKPYRVAFLFAFFQVALISALELLKPWPLKIVIDNVLQQQPLDWTLTAGWSRESLLLGACGAMITIYLVLGVISVVNNYTTIRIGQGMVNDLRRDLYAHLQRLSLAFHTRRGSAI